jgi:hypothetical protein
MAVDGAAAPYARRVAAVGVLLIIGSLGLGILGLVKRGYELLVVIAMGGLLLLGFVLLVKGLIG